MTDRIVIDEGELSAADDQQEHIGPIQQIGRAAVLRRKPRRIDAALNRLFGGLGAEYDRDGTDEFTVRVDELIQQIGVHELDRTDGGPVQKQLSVRIGSKGQVVSGIIVHQFE